MIAPGNLHDVMMAAELLGAGPIERLLADKAYDTNRLRTFLDQRGIEAVIRSIARRKPMITYDREGYRHRNLIERMFARLLTASLSRILFQLGRYSEAAFNFEKLTSESPERRARDMAWRAAAYRQLGRIDEARRYGEVFIRSVGSLWRGDPKACPPEYVDWLVATSYLRQPEDLGRLREGLRLGGLPA